MIEILHYIFLTLPNKYSYHVNHNTVVADFTWYFYLSVHYPNFNVDKWIFNTTGCEYLQLIDYSDSENIDLLKRWYPDKMIYIAE